MAPLAEELFSIPTAFLRRSFGLGLGLGGCSDGLGLLEAGKASV